MQVTFTLSRRDWAFLERYAEDANLASIDEAARRAIAMLRRSLLEPEYAEAWAAWAENPDAALWDTTVGDGLDPS